MGGRDHPQGDGDDHRDYDGHQDQLDGGRDLFGHDGGHVPALQKGDPQLALEADPFHVFDVLDIDGPVQAHLVAQLVHVLLGGLGPQDQADRVAGHDPDQQEHQD